tara:strand:+ start:335 stop:565 length:231 start_codon:yes stop_codon:yes gene_type:complete
MMVIQGTLPANTLSNNLVGDILHLPADRCAWTTSAVGSGGYQIDKAFFIHSTANVVITGPSLGYIGKSGRFVKIAI